MNLRQLETLLAIARLGGFAAAAIQLNATQSTISARIQELEQELGTPLVDRTQRKIQLTAKGRELVRYAEEAVALFTEIRHKIGSAKAIAGVVRLGVAELIAVTWLPVLIAAIHQDYPGLAMDLDISLTLDLMEKLRLGSIDVALVAGRNFDPNYAVTDLGSVPFMWMASPKLQIADLADPALALQSCAIFALNEKSYHYASVRSWLATHGGAFRAIDTCNSMSVMATLTAAGLGISMLPPICYQAELANGSLRVLDFPASAEHVGFSAVYRKQRPDAVCHLVAQAALQASTFATSPGVTRTFAKP